MQYPEAAVHRGSTKKVFLKILKTSPENTSAEAETLLKIDSSTVVFL